MVSERCIMGFEVVAKKILRFIAALHVPLSIAEIIMAVEYGKYCPRFRTVYTFLLVSGILGLVFGFSSGLAKDLYTKAKKKKHNNRLTDEKENYSAIEDSTIQEAAQNKSCWRTARKVIHLLVALFLFGWSIYRCVSLFDIYHQYSEAISTPAPTAPVTTTEPMEENTDYCRNVVVFAIYASIHGIVVTAITTILGISAACLFKKLKNQAI